MMLRVACDRSVRVHRLLSCDLCLDRLPASVALCMKVRSRQNYNLSILLKRSATVTVTTSTIHVLSLPKYQYCIEWSMHKVRFSQFLNKMAIVSRVLQLRSLLFSVHQVLNGNFDDRYSAAHGKERNLLLVFLNSVFHSECIKKTVAER